MVDFNLDPNDLYRYNLTGANKPSLLSNLILNLRNGSNGVPDTNPDDVFRYKLNQLSQFSPDAVFRQKLADIERMKNSATTPSSGSIWDSNSDPTSGALNSILSGAQAAASSPSSNSTDQILAQLQALQDPSRYMLNQSDLQQQAMNQASAQYDPLINELRREMQATETRAGRNKDILGSMFNELGQSIQGDLPVIQQQYTNTKNNVNQDYTNLSNQINDIYAQTQKDQQDLYNKLNIQAAAPSTIPQQERDKAYLQGVAANTNQTAQTALNQEQQGALDYTTKGSESARNEGVQRQADLMQQLSDYLTQAQGQIGDYTVSKQNAYQTGLTQLAQQNQTQALQRAQQDFNNYIASTNLGRGLQSDQLNYLKTMSGLQNQPVTTLGDVGNKALSLGLDQTGAQAIQDIMSSALLQVAVTGGASGINLSPEAKAAAIVQQGQQSGLSQAELNVLQEIALEYFGRR